MPTSPSPLAPGAAVTATVPVLEPPAWAVAERALFDRLDEAWRRFEEVYADERGRLRYPGKLSTRDGGDDFYEAFFNWPQLYLLGGSTDILRAAARHWRGVTDQLTELGVVRDDFERGYDWFHQGESALLFYGLTVADPGTWAGHARRFAELYTDPAHGNYDPARRIVLGAHNGTDGADRGLFDGSQYPWTQAEADTYGYPLDWLPGRAANGGPDGDPRLGEEMARRLGRGDVAMNMSISGLVLNAWLATGDEAFRTWVTGYVGGWRKRAEANDGVVPDNVDRNGVVGGTLDGRWYGGHYGWTWPHGLYSIGQAQAVAALSAALATSDDSYLDMVRTTHDHVYALARDLTLAESDTSIRRKAAALLGPDADRPTSMIPLRHSDRGPHDWNPPSLTVPMALWIHSGLPGDRARLERLRERSGRDWRLVLPFRDKEESGHEAPWFAFLTGDNPGYPERALAAAEHQLRRRLALIGAYPGEAVQEADIHLWQQVNPVVTEVLTQLTWGGPQVIYNGGHPQARVRYWDADAARPGLPADVAALVSDVEPQHVVVDLVNLSAAAERALVLQGGTFAEHRLNAVEVTQTPPDPAWPGDFYAYESAPPAPIERAVPVGEGVRYLTVTLPPGTRIRLTIAMTLRAFPPTLDAPVGSSL
ncbi:hypothetical protein [Amycolatopsis vastitatis]|uniref:Uncharacterized protein n=1 Tax=Amycolatopsis vastitatis TaxID=1905142 RepID=A0A229SME0_9PSEU|nr:hypothetical protein [Amycolatopsis vastitatis]OXM59980.1 hypothetical protein CF165_44575 [Amycolatopsis vastitatis]